jgi:hypothetical protein
MIGIHRFLEISVGIVVGLLLTAVWPEPEPAGSLTSKIGRGQINIANGRQFEKHVPSSSHAEIA